MPTELLIPGSTGTAAPRPLVKSFQELGQMYYGPGFASDQVVADLQKALATGSITGFGDATPLRLENLDGTMTAVLFQEAHLKIFSSMPRIPSAQPLFQWIRELEYGTERGAAGFREGGVPQTGVSSWVRGNIMNKYLGVRRGYTHQMLVTGQMGGAFVDPVARENRNGTRQLLAMIERQITFGLKSILDSGGNEVHYDGIIPQMEASTVAATNIIDKKGKPLDFEDLENGGEQFITQGKLLNFEALKLFATPFVLSDLAKLKLQAERRMLGQDDQMGYRPGVPLLGYRSQHGYLPFDESIFLHPVQDGKMLATANPGSPAAPAAPTMAATSDTTSNIEAGSYYYFTSAINDAGESLATASASAVACNAGDKVTLTITRSTGATGYRIYRGTLASGADAGIIKTVPDPGSGGTFNTYVDRNEWRPLAGLVIIMNLREEDMVLAQMAPLLKFPLAITSTTIEFLLLLYHVLAIKAPERVIVWKNIGRRA